ncbi:uncharacterized protein A4U43_C05F9850 [Asparagus officinalis]|uniref:Uncharacterized protein n=1 Tax=Asparagus officinalis TaxID=4686 RepID=A0A5P1EQM1_ASPOF|nr:uncharacterized protein A4U43_C05F9850 [Asparagus officinalis]
MKKSKVTIYILPEQDMPQYVHREIKQEPTKRKAKGEEKLYSENSLRKKRVKKEEGSQSTVVFTEAYEKLSMLNEVYEQEIVSLGIDTKAIKAEKEDDQGKEMEEVKDDSTGMGIEVE